MEEGLVYGWRTAILSIVFVQLLALAWAMTRPLENRVANRTLSALLIVLAGMITPWMIGFAGFYDRWQWLSFAPFAISLAIAPLTYLYMASLIHGSWPKNGYRHLIPAIVQFTYLGTAFLLLRQPFKNEWLERSSPAYDMATAIGVIAGLAYYGARGRTMIRLYRGQLMGARSDVHRFALVWLDRAASALSILLAIWAAYSVWDLFWPLGYRGLMGLYLAIAAFALFLGIEGWRHAALPFPRMADLIPPADQTAGWTAKAEEWAARIERDRLFTDPELSVARLAKILGTNTAYVSRALNEGLGESFSAFINRLRCEDVASRLRSGATGDLLDLALESGFSSKASFNRAFLATFGCSPSAYRRSQVSKSK